MTHELKIWKNYFNDILFKGKRFEVRKAERGFQVGDILTLREYNPIIGKYSGAEIKVKVNYIWKVNQDILPVSEPYVIMQFDVINYNHVGFLRSLLSAFKESEGFNEIEGKWWK